MRGQSSDDELRALTRKRLRRYVRRLEAALDRESRRADEQAERANSLRRRLQESVKRNYQLRDSLLEARQMADVVRQTADLALSGPPAGDDEHA